MKRKSILMIGACMMLVMAACGAKGEKPELPPEPTKAEKPEATATVAPTEAEEPTVEPTEEPVMEPTAMPEPTATPIPTETPTPEPTATSTPVPTPALSFDNSWASNEFEMLIPQPPVGESDWKTEQKDDDTYRITTYGPNLNVAVFMDYVQLLSTYGFSIEESMAEYIYIATDANGNEVKLLREADIHQYTIKKAK